MIVAAASVEIEHWFLNCVEFEGGDLKNVADI